MVLDFYKLPEPPFGVTPDPEYLYLGETHREALASLLHGLTEGRGFTALIAGAGMGKTALLRLIVQKLQGATQVAFLPHAHLTPRELLSNLLATLGAEPADDSFLVMHARLNEILVREYNAQKRFVIVIDEAQDLGEPSLELLRVLSNVETPREKLMHFVLSGHPQLAEKLASPQLVQLRQRVSIIARLEPFGAEETRLYIDHRLRVAGYDFSRPLFTPRALELIADCSLGVPRNINNVCFNALSLGFVHRQQTIDADVIHEVLEDLDLQKVIASEGEVPFVAKPLRADLHITHMPVDSNGSGTPSPSPASDDVASQATATTGEPRPEHAAALEDWKSQKEAELSGAENVAQSLAQIVPVLEERLQQRADHFARTAIASRIEESLRTALLQIEDFWKAGASQSEENAVARLADMHRRWEEELAVHRNRVEETSKRLELLGAKAGQGLLELQKFVTRVKSEIEPQVGECLNQSLLRAASELETIASHIAERHQADLDRASQTAVREAQSRMDEALADRSAPDAPTPAPISEEHIQSLVDSSRGPILKHLDDSLAGVYRQLEQQQEQVRQRTEEFSQQLEKMTAGLNQAQAQNEESVSEIRSLLASRESGLSQDHLDSRIELERGLIFNHLENKLSEVSNLSEQHQELARQRTAEVTQQLEGLAAWAQEIDARQAQSSAELGAQISGVSENSEERINRLLAAAREEFRAHVDSRLEAMAGLAQQEQKATRRQLEELSLRLEQLVAENHSRLLETRDLVGRISEISNADSLGAIDQSAKRALHEIENSAVRISDRQLVRMTEQKQTLARELALELEARATETRAIIEKSANTALEEFRRHLELQNELIIGDATQRITSTIASLDAEYCATRDTHHQTLKTEVAQAAEQSMSEFRSGIKAFLYSCLVAAVSAVDQHAQTTLDGLSNDANQASRKLDLVFDPAAEPGKRSSAATAK